MYQMLDLLKIIFIVSLALIVIKAADAMRPTEINCSSAISVNSPVNDDYLFEGTVYVRILTNGEGLISLSGVSFSKVKPESNRKHMLINYRFQVSSRQNNTFEIDDVRLSRRQRDNMDDNEASSIVQDLFDFKANRVNVEKLSNSYIFGGIAGATFICVEK